MTVTVADPLLKSSSVFLLFLDGLLALTRCCVEWSDGGSVAAATNCKQGGTPCGSFSNLCWTCEKKKKRPKNTTPRNDYVVGARGRCWHATTTATARTKKYVVARKPGNPAGKAGWESPSIQHVLSTPHTDSYFKKKTLQVVGRRR